MAFNIMWIFKAIQIAGVVAAWSQKALADGKITLSEATQLAGEIATVLGVAVEIEIPGAPPSEK